MYLPEMHRPFGATLLYGSWLLFTADATANDQIPFPFEGSYESKGSVALEKVTADSWREIPQDVELLISKTDDAIELRLHIAVQAADSGTSKYSIRNRMWLVKRSNQSIEAGSNRVELDVYKCNPISVDCRPTGDGFCDSSQCRYSYVTARPGHQQRYSSHISWQTQQLSTMFTQTGALSVRKDDSQQWATYKTWDNSFVRASQNP